MSYIPLALALGGGASLVAGIRAYLKGPRCRWSGSCRVAIVGDSVSAGGGYSNYLTTHLPRYEFQIYGGVGQGTQALFDVLLQDVLPGNFDEVIIQGGLNDLSRPDSSSYIIANLERMVRAAKAAGARVILLSLTPWHQAAQQIKEINKQLRWRAPFWGVDDYVDIWKPLADDSGALRSDLVGDLQMRVHPNRAGHDLVGEKILRDAY